MHMTVTMKWNKHVKKLLLPNEGETKFNFYVDAVT